MRNVVISGVLATTTLLTEPGSAQLSREDYTIHSEPGIRLQVREVRARDGNPAVSPPVILVHGARVPGVASFDLPVAGGSLAADLARTGRRIFVMDARGYGGSTRPGQDGTSEGKPLVSSNEVVRDIGAVVEDVRRRTGADVVALLGWATGGHWAGMYASLYPHRVSHLVLYNTLYGAHRGHTRLGPGSSMEDPDVPGRFNVARFGAYRLNTAASLAPSWDDAIPLQDKSAWRDPDVLAAYQRAALASDPTSASRQPPSFRAPSGALEDSFRLASGRQLWDAAPIEAHVLIIRSAFDFWSRPEDVTGIEEHLVNAASVRAVTIQEATHHVHLDRPLRGRREFLEEVVRMLERSSAESETI
jgi:pimeloyl-ACP methyl ester carboxylesterase